MDFTARTVVVTGAAGGLGRPLCRAFAAAGAEVVAVDADAGRLEEAFAGSEIKTVAVDLLDEAATARALAMPADVLCCIAGGFDMGRPVHETATETWDLLADLNVRTLLHSVKAVGPGMVARGSGRIVTVGANAAKSGVADMGAYCATKSAVMRLTESMAMELRGKGVNVNGVLPSIIDTPANRAAMPDADPAKWVSPDDLAAVVMFLASDAAKAVHGALVPVVGLS